MPEFQNYRQEVHSTHVDPVTGQAVNTSTVSGGTVNPDSTKDRTNMVIWYVASILLGLLAIRFILLLLGANLSNTFANFIYNLTNPFVMPFNSLFGTPSYGTSKLDLATVVAVLVYTLIIYAITKLVDLTRKDPSTANTQPINQ